MTPPGANGVTRVFTIVATVIPFVMMLGSVFYVAFQGQANYVAIGALNDRAAKTELSLRQVELDNARTAERLVEVETQICAVDDTRNLSHASDLRLFALILKKMGEDYPIGDAYYPRICKNGPSKKD